MNQNKNYLALKKACRDSGADLFGVADIKEIKKDFRLRQAILRKLDRAVCLGVELSGGLLEEIEEEPTRLYFHHYRTANLFLDQLALKATILIQRKGFTALPIPSSLILDWQNTSGHLAHKKIAVSAGLGWIGRNNLLVNKESGSRLRLVSILTDMPLKTDRPLRGGDCGECRRCIKACPAGAIKESPLEFDQIRCFEKLKEFQKKHMVDQYICGVCVSACRGRRDA